MVSDGTRLPPVSLLGPLDDPDTIPVTLNYRNRPWAAVCLFLMLAVPVLLVFLSATTFAKLHLPTGLLSSAAPWAEIILLILALRQSAPVKVRYYASRDLLEAQSRRVSRLRRFLLLTAALILMGLGFQVFQTLAICLGLAVLFALIFRLTWTIRPRCRRIRGGWAHITRISPEALDSLSGPQGPPAPLRTIQIFTLHREKLSVSQLINGRWNRPWLILSVLILKAIGKRALALDLPYESAAVALSTIPKPLLDMIERLPGGPGRRVLRTRRIESLNGSHLIESCDLISHDLCHTAAVTLTTSSSSRGPAPEFIAAESWAFATVLTDGTVVTTRSSPIHAPIAGFEAHAVRGRPIEIWEKHLAAVNDRTLQPASESEWLARFDLWADSVHQALVKAGLRSPLREVAVPGETVSFPVTKL